MLKAAGIILVVGAAALLGINAAAELEASYQELLYLKRLMEMLKGEIRYSRAALSHIFLKLEKEAKSPYDEWLRKMSGLMESRCGKSLTGIWRESAAEALCGSKLPEKEKQKLGELGALLGDSSLETQIDQLEGYLEQLNGTIRDTRSELRDKKKLYRCLGIIGGMFVAILLA